MPRNTPSIPNWVPPLDTGQPSANDINSVSEALRETVAARNTPIPIPYGRDRIFAQPFVVHVCEVSGCLMLALGVGEGEIAGYESIYVDGVDVLANATGYISIKNRSFETGDTYGWPDGTGTVVNTQSYVGNYSLRLACAAGGPNHFSDLLPCPPEGTRIRVSAYVMRDEGALPDNNTFITIRFTAGGTRGAWQAGDSSIDGNQSVAGWQYVERIITVPAGQDGFEVDLGESGGTTGFWFWDQVRVHLVDANDEEIDAIEFVPYTGSTSQQFDGILNASISGYEDNCPGLAYVVGRFPRGTTSGFPRVEVVYQGRKVFDPRKYNLLYDDDADPFFVTAAETDETIADWFNGVGTYTTNIAVYGWTTEASDPAPVGTTYGELIDNDDSTEGMFSRDIPVDTTKQYTVAVYAKQPSGDRRHYLLVAFKDAQNNNIIANADSSTGWSAQGTYYYWSVVNTAFAGTWTRYTFTFGAGTANEFPQDTVPAVMRIGGLISRDGPVGTNTTIRMTDFRIWEGALADEQDPNDSSTWAYTTNPAICFRDLITSFTDWDIWDAGVADLANYNEEEIEAGVPRRAIGLTLVKPDLINKWAQTFRTYMGAFLGWEGGKLRVIPNRPDVEAQGAVFGDGVDGEVSMGNPAELNFTTGDFTVEAWFKTADATGTKVIVGKKDAAASGTSAGYSIVVSDTEVRAYVSDGTVGVSDAIAGTFDDNEWHHIALVVDQTADDIEIFADGVASGSPTSIAGMGSFTTTEAFRLLGDETGNFLNGSVDEVRVWNVVRTPTQITDNMFNEIANPASVASLVGYWRCNTTGTTVLDWSNSGNTGSFIGGSGFTGGNPQVIPDGVAMHITADDIVKDSLKLRRRSLRAVPNSVAIDYMEASGTRWRTERVQKDSARLTGGLERRRLSRISLPGIHNASQAQREATERLNWYLTDLEATLTLFDEGWRLQNGSIVAVTHPLGLDAKLFRVTRITGVSGRWTVDLAEYDPAVYSEEVIADPTVPDTNLGDPLNPPLVTGLSAAEELFKYKNGITGSRIRITYNSTVYPFFSQFLVQGYVDNVKVWETTTQSNIVVTPGVEELVEGTGAAVDYEVRVYIQSPFATGDFVSSVVNVQGKLLPPADVTTVNAEVISAGQVELEWAPVDDIDIWRYEVRQGDPVTNDTWDEATFLDRMDDIDTVVTGLAVGDYRFFIKAVDSVQNYSTNAAYVDISITEPPPVTSVTGFEIASEVRLRWDAPATGFVERYRIAYDTVTPSSETTLDIVDTLTFSTKDVPEGTWKFLVYSRDAVGNEATTPATIDIEVTSDADAFLADTYDFVQATDQHANGTLTNMHEFSLRLTDKLLYVTNMGDVFSSSPSDFNTYSGEPLANYHSSGSSLWLSETKDFGILLTGSWNLTHDVTALNGTYEINLELSADDVNYEAYGTAAKGEFRYARVRITTTTDSTAFVKSPIMSLKINVVPIEENGDDVGNATDGVPKVVNLTREYTAVKEVNVQPKYAAGADSVMAVVDNIVVGSNTGVQCDGTNYLQGSDFANLDFGTGDFTIEFWTKHSGSTSANQMLICKRQSTSLGWFVRADYNINDLEFWINDSVVAQSVNTTGDALPNDGNWHHYAVVVQRGATNTVTWYVDGSAQTPVSISTVTGTISNTGNFGLFRDNGLSQTHESGGYLDEVRIWSDARTSGEITANYQSELDMTQTWANLEAYYRLNGQVSSTYGGGTEADASANGYDLTDTGAGDITFVDPGSSSPVQKINSFDVYLFDIFGQQTNDAFQWNWKGV